MPDIEYSWRGVVDNNALNELHAEAFEHGLFNDDWSALLARHSLGWVTASDEAGLVGFVNVPWDGLIHSWVQDTIVAKRVRRQGVGKQLLSIATQQAREAGCEWLHVDFDDEHSNFYLDACGFEATSAGLIRLR